MSELTEKYDFLFYRGGDGSVKIEVIVGDETVWLNQKSLAELFGVQRPAITKHLQNIFQEGELHENSVSSILEHTAEDGKTYKTAFYNLDAIIAVGYRVNSYEATQFRIWASSILKEYMVKGFVLDDERLKQGKQVFGKDFFDELLERIREIRASERRFYQKITDIYKDCSIDYDPNSPITHNFYATVQNKLHWAIHKHTAAELIKLRADSNSPNMGLTTWKNAGTKGKILKTDVVVAKNYLTKEELTQLNRVVTMYLDFAENMAERQKALKMQDWAQKLDSFLQFNEYDILHDAGRITHAVAVTTAEKEYAKYRVIQDREYKSDFDKTLDEVKDTGKLPAEPPVKEKHKKAKILTVEQHSKAFEKKEKDIPPSKKNKKKNK